MLTKTNVMFFIGAWMTSALVLMIANLMVSPEWANYLSIQAGLIYAVFAFSSSVRRAVVISALTLVWGASVFYFLHVRHDAVGFTVMATCFAFCYFLGVRPLKRNLQRG